MNPTLDSATERIAIAQTIMRTSRTKTDLRRLAKAIVAAFEYDGLTIVGVDPAARTITIGLPPR